MSSSPAARLKSNKPSSPRAPALLALLVGASWAAPGAAASAWETLGGNGSLRAGVWEHDKSLSEASGYGLASAWLTLSPEAWEGYKIYASGFIQAADHDGDTKRSGDLRELFVEKSFGALDLKLGRAITVWGRADKLNPSDHLSVRDYRLLTVNDEDQLRGLGTVQAAYNDGPWRFIALWLPEWRAPQFPFPEQPGVAIVEREPEHRAAYAFKADNSGGSIDWSLSYYHGPNRIPDLKLLSFGPGGVEVGVDFGPIDSYSADFASTLGSWGLRGEASYTTAQDSRGRDPTRQNDQLYAVFGVERSPWENFNVNAQLLYKHVDDYSSPRTIANPGLRAIVTQAQITSNQLASDQAGLSLRPSYKLLNETLELEVAYVQWLSTSSSLIAPKVNYALSDHIRAYLGAEIYRGREESFFGRLRKASSAYGEIRFNI